MDEDCVPCGKRARRIAQVAAGVVFAAGVGIGIAVVKVVSRGHYA